MPEPVTVSVVAVSVAKKLALAAIAEIAKGVFFGSDKKKLKKALEDIKNELSKISGKVDQVYEIVLDIQKSLIDLKIIVESIPSETNVKASYVAFEEEIDSAFINIESALQYQKVPEKLQSALLTSFNELRTKRKEYLSHRLSLSVAIHASALDILYFFYFDIQLTIAYVKVIFTDKTYDEQRRIFLSEIVSAYEEIFFAISNQDNTGTIDLHISQIQFQIESKNSIVRPNEEYTTLTYNNKRGSEHFGGGSGEPLVNTWWDDHSILTAKKNFADTPDDEIAIEVTWLQFLRARYATIDSLGVENSGWNIRNQSRYNPNTGEFEITNFSLTELTHVLKFKYPLVVVPEDTASAEAARNFLDRVNRLNQQLEMKKTLEMVKIRVIEAQLKLGNETFRNEALFIQLQKPLETLQI